MTRARASCILLIFAFVLLGGSATTDAQEEAATGATGFDVRLTLRRDIGPGDLRVSDPCQGSSWEHEEGWWFWEEMQGAGSECSLVVDHAWPAEADRIRVRFDWHAHPSEDSVEDACRPRTAPSRALSYRVGTGGSDHFALGDIYNGVDARAGSENLTIPRMGLVRESVMFAWVAQDAEVTGPGGMTASAVATCTVPGFDILPETIWSVVERPDLRPVTKEPIKELARRSDGFELPLGPAFRDEVYVSTHDVTLEVRVPHTAYRLHAIRNLPNGTIETPEAPAPIRSASGTWLSYSGPAALALLEGGATLVLIDTTTTPDGLLVTQSPALRMLLFTVPFVALAAAVYDTGRYVHRAGDAQRRDSVGYATGAATLTAVLAVASVPAVVQDRLYELERGEPSAALVAGLVGLVGVMIVSLLLVRHLRGSALVTVERQRAAERAEQEKIAARSEELQGFVAGLGHDLKTPLIALDWLTKDIEEELLSGDPDELRESIGRIRKNVGGMDRLVKDLLELTRIDQGTHDETRVDLREVLDEVVETVDESARRRGTTIHVDRRSLPAVLGDHALWRQVFLNLVGNAVKYGRAQDGHVHVRAERVRDGGLRMEVEDDGAGIPDEEKTTVFEMFRRGSTGASQEGTGLGLALVRKIVERYDGTIQVEDAEGGGARFVIVVPADVMTSALDPDVAPGASAARVDPSSRNAP